MKIIWQIDPEDVAKVQSFFDRHRSTPFVKRRIAVNLRREKPPVAKVDFWSVMVGCLLTTQQRSGPDTAVSRFLLTNPSPLGLDLCRRQGNLAIFASKILAKFGGIRRSTMIGKELAANLRFLDESGWAPTLEHLEAVRRNPRAEIERRAAEFVDEHFKGFGPKQSRNLLQGLGLSRYEITLDSRITKWLNDFGFPLKLTANALSDREYYNFVSNGFQQLCEACGIKPCALDAAIFASFDGGRWTEENIVW